jgi:hypothetical protein
MTTERVVTLKVDTSLLFDAIKQMGGNCSPLGERLASVLLSTGSPREMIGLLGVYGIEIEGADALSAVASERDAAAIRAFGQRVWSDTEETAYQAGVSDTRARLQEPNVQDAVRAAVIAEYVESEDLMKIADAVIARIVEMLK